nr:hypothetical protein [uncultured Massilia sp.]
MSSSRRSNGEISILAMLDGKSRRSLSRRLPSLPAMLGYVAAGTAACTLVGVLAWLAHDGIDRPAMTAGGNKAVLVAQAPAAPADAGTETVAPDKPAPPATNADVPAPAGGAAIVDAPPPDIPVPVPVPVPVSVSVSAPQSTSDAAPSLQTSSSSSTAAALSAAPSMSTISHPSAAPAAAQGVVVKSVVTRPLASYRQPAQPAVRPSAAARPKRSATPSKPAAPAVDMDVALITAIIQHAARPLDATGVEHANATCAGKACGPRMPEQQ